jgi:3-phosphoshikimate 1-carboxyvinyltransferase
MNIKIHPHRFTGNVKIPASKSHTIRQLLIASLADGKSEISDPLNSLDTSSCLEACRVFGAEINCDNPLVWKIDGNNGFKKTSLNNSNCESLQIDVGNSGTTLYLALAVAGLQSRPISFTGDEQIRKRSASHLLDALAELGIIVKSNNGYSPITIKGPWKGGRVSLPCPTSQYLSALLIAAPLAASGTVTEIDVPLLNEKPYIDMTLSYLKMHNIPFKAEPDFSNFIVPGGSAWKGFSGTVPADFSSAAFPAAAAAITGGPVTLLGLDLQDTQGDKYFLEMLEKMGCTVKKEPSAISSITVSREKPLCGGIFDLNKTPDLLPAAAVVAAYAMGDTMFVNVAHARMKETDRIAVIMQELAKLGVCCTELPDGLIVHGKRDIFPQENTPIIEGHGDHRIVMAFAAAALGSPVPLEITTAESANVTYPGFLSLLDAKKVQ